MYTPLQGGMRRTALHWACQGGHVRMVELLMDFGADTKVHTPGAPHGSTLLPDVMMQCYSRGWQVSETS